MLSLKEYKMSIWKDLIADVEPLYANGASVEQIATILMLDVGTIEMIVAYIDEVAYHRDMVEGLGREDAVA
jgi:hypothetical protein